VLAQATNKQIDLGVNENQSVQKAVYIPGQQEGLRMMLRNLLENAVKYTPASGRVDVSLELDESGGREAMLTIEDSGPGIAPEDRARAFDRFFRAADVSLEPGSGLGLAIVKVIAERNGGSIALSASEKLGGLRVDVRFPLAQPL
jgi:two-component system OmpR family sensor kinase